MLFWPACCKASIIFCVKVAISAALKKCLKKKKVLSSESAESLSESQFVTVSRIRGSSTDILTVASQFGKGRLTSLDSGDDV